MIAPTISCIPPFVECGDVADSLIFERRGCYDFSVTELTTDLPKNSFSIPKASQTLRVLVLDDEEALRTLVKKTLEQAGCEVSTAADGGEGLQVLLNKRFDVVVSDLMMQPMDGITFLTEAHHIWPWMGVVVFSGLVENEIRQRAMDIGISTILEKPVSFRDLAAAVMEEGERMRKRIQGENGVTLDHIQYELSILRDITRAAIEASNLPQALRDLGHKLGEALPTQATAILNIEEKVADSMLVLSLQETAHPTFINAMETEVRNRFKLLSGNSLPKDIIVEVQGAEPDETGVKTPGNVFCVPIINDRTVGGILALSPPQTYTYNETDMSFFYHAANHLTTVMSAFQRIRDLAVRDELTGLYNRHHLQNELDSVWNLAQRYGFSTGIIIADLDHLKTINDTYGHPMGDAVLKELSEIALNVCRTSDIIARYGGDELIIVLPDVIPDNLGKLAERLLFTVRNHTFCQAAHQLHETISLGAASNRTEDGTILDPYVVLSHADNALYKAKRDGRDRCVIWNQDLPSTEATTETESSIAIPASDTISKTTPTKVVVVDDDPAVIRIMKLLLETEGCESLGFESGSEARTYINENPGKVDVAFIDLNLEEENGLDLIREFKGTDSAMVNIVITGDATLDNAVNSLRHGAYDFIQKPVQREQLHMTISRAIEYRQLRLENLEYQNHLEDMVRRKSRELTNALQRTRDSFEFTLRAMTRMLDAREHTTGEHSQRVQTMTMKIAKASGLEGQELEDVHQGALLHDIGKIAIPDNILLKNGPLTNAEWKVMRTHAQVGYDIIKTSPDLQGPSKVVGYHHEQWDGLGYPHGSAGEDIPIGARIFALADAYDAMRSDRPYRTGMSKEDALAEIQDNSGSQFDPRLVDVFMTIVDDIETIGKWSEENEKAASNA